MILLTRVGMQMLGSDVTEIGLLNQSREADVKKLTHKRSTRADEMVYLSSILSHTLCLKACPLLMPPPHSLRGIGCLLRT